MASLFKKISGVASAVSTVKSVTSAFNSATTGSQAGSAFSSALTQASTNSAINSISGFGGSLANKALGSSGLGSALGVVSGISSIAGLSGLANATGALSNILSGNLGPQLGIFDNPIRVLQRSAGEIFDARGGRFEEMRTLVSNLSELNAFDSFIKNLGIDIRDPLTKIGASSSAIPNPLREFASYNYKITLGILSNAEYNNPETYRSVGFSNYIIKSTGGNLGKRVQTEAEVSSNSLSPHAEYYIDELTYDGVVAPNPKTGVTLGTTFSFVVTEPYSMGNFIQALVVGAKTANNGAGYDNYFTAPFCLKIEFSGFAESYGGSMSGDIAPIYLPMLITNVEMTVSGQGTRYECSGVAYNELGLADHMNTLYTQIHSAGVLAHTVLQNGDKSLTSGLNKRIEKMEDAEIIPGYDRFIICFPKEKDSIKKFLQAGLQQTEEPDAAQTFVEQRGTQETADQIAQDENFNNQDRTSKQIQVKPVTSLFETLLAFAEDVASMNEIGLSPLLEDASQGGNQDAPSMNGSYQSDELDAGADAQRQEAKDDPCGGEEVTVGLVDKNAASLTPGEFSRSYEFNKGEAITTCIEKVLLTTEYCKENATKDEDDNGLRTWFMIDSQIYLEENKDTENDMGRPPVVVVYSIMPYKTSGAKATTNSQTPKNIKGLMSSAAKEYNYLYTGKNEDVLNFDINLSTAFMRTVSANYGNNAGGKATPTGNQLVTSDQEQGGKNVDNPNQDAKENVEATAGTKEVKNPSVSMGTRDKDIRRQAAENFHDILLNTPTDLVTAQMSIWGDPFFLPQEIGNFHPARSGSSPSTTEVGTMTYTEGEVFCVVNFRSPFDYEDGGSLVEMPMLVPQFSGLYSVVLVSNVFSKGQFTQDLHLVRIPGQDRTVQTENVPGGLKVGEIPLGYSTANVPNASMVDDTMQNIDNAFSSATSIINKASNLLAQASNAGLNVGKLSSVANQASGLVSSAQGSFASASNALSSITSAGASASNALSSLTSAVPGSLGSGSFGLDQAAAITNALVSAVPAFGQVSVDLNSTEGKIAIAGADLQAQLQQAFGDFIPPEIEDKAVELAEALPASIQNADITAAVATTTDILIPQAKKGVSV